MTIATGSDVVSVFAAHMGSVYSLCTCTPCTGDSRVVMILFEGVENKRDIIVTKMGM